MIFEVREKRGCFHPRDLFMPLCLARRLVPTSSQLRCWMSSMFPNKYGSQTLEKTNPFSQLVLMTSNRYKWSSISSAQPHRETPSLQVLDLDD
jgi:hypothetical protein